MCDWAAAEREYVTGEDGYRGIAKKYGVSKSSVERQGRLGNWQEKRQKYRDNITVKSVQKAEEKISDKLSDMIALQADTAIKIAATINEYLTDGTHWKPFDLLRIANTWQILQDNLLKQKDMTDTDDQLPKYVALLPDRTEIDDVDSPT